jgi:RimJ/RimL family protein N-acetyltransferase
MPATLHTARLRLEPWDASHGALLGELSSDAAVMRYIGDGSLWSGERVGQVSASAKAHWERHGFGWRAIHDAPTSRAIGIGMLGFPGEGAGIDPFDHEIGWWLAPDLWGRGLAREAAAALRDEAFSDTVAAPSIVARVQPANAASLAVARAVGLEFERDGVGRLGEPIAILRLASAGSRAR